MTGKRRPETLEGSHVLIYLKRAYLASLVAQGSLNRLRMIQ
jgi:hypothetical protein